MQTKEQKKVWEKWLSERPENVRKVAEKIVPWKKYINKKHTDDIGHRYTPISYGEHEDGRVTITCEKSNHDFPFFNCNVFGMSPDDLIEDEEYTSSMQSDMN